MLVSLYPSNRQAGLLSTGSFDLSCDVLKLWEGSRSVSRTNRQAGGVGDGTKWTRDAGEDFTPQPAIESIGQKERDVASSNA
jgi:hypothetical protein